MHPKAMLQVYKINWLKRYSNSNVHNAQNVASHSHMVSFIAQIIGDLENLKRKENEQLNIEEILRKAINHDIGESLFGDLISPVKNYNEEFYSKVKEVEHSLIEDNIISKVPKELKEKYKSYILGSKEGLEGKLVDLADLMECLFYALSEKKLGNAYMVSIFHNTVEMIIEKGYLKLFPSARKIITYLKREMSGNE